jgi:hypothetical protein
MIPAMGRSVQVIDQLPLPLSRKRALLGFLGLPASIRALLLRLVVRMRFFVVVAALATEEEQNLLRVAGTHTDSFRIWLLVVKRTTLPQGKFSP